VRSSIQLKVYLPFSFGRNFSIINVKHGATISMATFFVDLKCLLFT